MGTMTTTQDAPTMRLIVEPNLGPRPEWAKAVIVAVYEEDQSDSMTDYFATRSTREVWRVVKEEARERGGHR